MERAKYELEEHRVECVSALRLSPSIQDPIDDCIDHTDAETAELFQLA